MPREARRKSDCGIYHVMLRGINQQTIFEDDEDCDKYLQCLKDCKLKSGFILYAYCLMGNHVHLLMQEQKEPLETIFKRIGSQYVYWYNWKYKRSGHLFQDRFKSEPINDDKQFVAVLRYIFQNPVKAQLCKKAADYRWSSYYSGGCATRIIDEDKLFNEVSAEQLRSLVEEAAGDEFIDLTQAHRLTDREAHELMKKLCNISSAPEFQSIEKDQQEKLLGTLHREGCSIRQLVRITGVSKARVERNLK